MLSFLRRNPALWTGLAFAFGIALSFEFIAQINIRIWAVVLAVLFFLLIIFAKKFVGIFLLLTLFLFFALGVIYGYQHFAFLPKNHLLNFDPNKIKVVRGWISDALLRKNGRHRYLLQCRQAFIDSSWQPVSGKVLLFVQKGSSEMHYGQRVQINGKLERPPLPANPGQFNYRRYLNLRGIFFQIYASKDSLRVLPGIRGSPIERSILEPLRWHIRNSFDGYLPSFAAAIVKALILGDRQDLNRKIVNQFQQTGVVHVLAISGLHVGFVLLIFLLFFGFFPLSYKIRYLLTFIALGFFVALVNFKAPVVRASLMAVFYFGVSLSQRKASPLNILAAAGFLILLFAPSQVLQPGFQFSFAAVGGIVYGYPHLKRIFPIHGDKHFLSQVINRWVWQPVFVSLSAILATMPLTWYYFGTLQIGGVLINLLVIPLIGLLVVLSLLFVMFSFVAFPLLGGLAQLITWIVQGILTLVGFFSRFHWVQLTIAHPSLWIIFSSVLLLVFLFRIYKQRNWMYVGFLFVVVLVIWQHTRLSHLRIIFMDVGQGDACLVQLPCANVLIDAGDRSRWRDYGIRSVLPVCRYYGVKHLRYAIATHSHSDHYGGFISVLQNLDVDTLVLSPYPDSSSAYLGLKRLAKRLHIPIRFVQRGKTLNVGEEARAYVLSPISQFEKLRVHNGKEINNSSLVIRLQYGQSSFLLTGDAQREAEAVMIRYGNFLQSNLIKVGHHGSSTSSTDEFLRFVQPKFAIVSVGKRNKFHHPSIQTINRFKASGISVLRTDKLGAIVFESDGSKIRLINWRK